MYSIFTNFFDNFFDILVRAIYIVPVILISLSFHEFSHGFAAYKMGDYTAKSQGRLTLNPLAHLDPLGTIMLLISSFSGFGFGWAKPVQINPAYFRKPKWGMVTSALAGPVSNFVLALASGLVLVIGLGIAGFDASLEALYNNETTFITVFAKFMTQFITMNIGLGMFNLIPFPPLDGAKILGGFLPQHMYFKVMEYERYIGLVFIAIIVFVPGFFDSILTPCFQAGFDFLGFILTPIARLFDSKIFSITEFSNILYLIFGCMYA